MSVSFRLLGEVGVYLDDQPVEIGSARIQCVLAGLLIDANRCVPTDRLVERVWGDQRLPRRPRSALQTYVSLLRRALAGKLTITRKPAGYLARVAEESVDVHHFGGLVRQAAAADDDGAARLLQEALGLWRGEAFGTLDTPWLASVRAKLDKERRAARLELADIQLRRGAHARLLTLLAEWIDEYPLDERLAGQYMLALHRSGRVADALQVFRRVRERLIGELGTEPGADLRCVHRQVLAADPTADPVTAARARVPRQLPGPPWSFVGRGPQLALLDSACAAQESAATLPILALRGPAGIGKTWLGLRWAHQNLGRFPDGQLYVNLRGSDPSGLATPASTALHGFLTALGVEPGTVPADLDARSALFRSVTADKRLLIMLDDARDAEQIIPLLPGNPSCVVLLSMRTLPTVLVSAHGAVPVSLAELSDTDACAVLTHRIGADRVHGEGRAIEEIARCCGGMPLALGLAAARATTQARLPLTALAAQLLDTPKRFGVSVRRSLRGSHWEEPGHGGWTAEQIWCGAVGNADPGGTAAQGQPAGTARAEPS